MSDEAIKLEALGRIKAGARLADLVTDMGISYPKLLAWKKELKAAEEAGTVDKLVNVDKLVVHEIAEHVRDDLVALGADAETVQGELSRVSESIDGLQVLNQRLQSAGLKLAQQITNLSDVADNARDVQTLVAALAQLQTAFFAKAANNIVNILNNNSGADGLSMFKSAMRD